MPIVIQPYEERHQPAVDAFNQRLATLGAGDELVFFRWAKPRFLPHSESTDVYNEFFLALDGEIVRGGYALKHQRFLFPDGHIESIGYYHHPLSEGLTNKAYALVGTLLLRHALQRSPLLYCLGMGGYDRPLPKMLVGLGWKHCLVPFYFRVVHPYRFLRGMNALRSSFARKLLLDLAAFSGAGWLANQSYKAAAGMRALRARQSALEVVQDFSTMSDALWEGARQDYAFTAVRDSCVLRALYTPGDQLTKLVVNRGGAQIGWAVVGERRSDARYGNLRVGCIVDCWAASHDAHAVVLAAMEVLENQGADLIVSNQSHHAWSAALQKSGFLKAPSNFIFAASKPLTKMLEPFDKTATKMHLNRADGDGLPRNF